ncbi:MAG: septal ring lytic transglycosylase RlpA family protein [Deltaproteobacteria bacterium]|nr:septal ring lytic transglycosylase RlpA family protein [Deltaproteobacteria bacterium]
MQARGRHHARHHARYRGRHRGRRHGRRSASRRIRPRPVVPRGRFVQYGKATWYGGRFNGGPTASGERFNQDAMTAAHKRLPFDTLVRVTRIDNKQSVVVRINDRGPYGKGRVIDLSREAAKRLHMLRAGVVRVRLDVIKWGRGRYRRSSRRRRSSRGRASPPYRRRGAGPRQGAFGRTAP